MKTLRITLIAVLVSSFTFGTAFSGIQMEEKGKNEKVGFVSSPGQDRVIVSFEMEDNKAYEIKISDIEGNTYHSEVVNDGGVFSKRYDLEELGDGEYVISIENQQASIASQSFLKR